MVLFWQLDLQKSFFHIFIAEFSDEIFQVRAAAPPEGFDRPGLDHKAVKRSANNLPEVKTLRASYLNVRDLLNYDYVIMPTDALAVVEEILG